LIREPERIAQSDPRDLEQRDRDRASALAISDGSPPWFGAAGSIEAAVSGGKASGRPAHAGGGDETDEEGGADPIGRLTGSRPAVGRVGLGGRAVLRLSDSLRGKRS